MDGEEKREKGMVMDMSLLEIRGLETEFQTEQGVVKALRGIDYTVDKGEVLGIVGESGSGKSVGMLSLMGLLAPNGTVTAGEMIFDGEDISPVKYKTKKEKKEYEKKMNAIRGNDISMIFQDPMSYLNPIVTIEKQMTEGIRAHDKCSKQEARERAIELMKMVGIPAPESRLKQYPFEFELRVIYTLSGKTLSVKYDVTNKSDVDMYYGIGGQLCHYPKFEPDKHIILKLTPSRREGNWYRWNQEIPLNSPPELVQVAAEFSKLKIGFRGDLPFRNAEAIDVAEFLHGSIVCRNVETTSELWKRLSEKVEQNWQTYQRNLYDRSPGVLIGIADEIAATATCYSEFLCSGSDLSRRDLSYLLQFENPLDVLRDRWVLDQSTEQGTRFLGMLESLRSEGHAEQDYPLDEAYAQTQKNEMTMQL